MRNVYFAGAQGTGKSSVIEALKGEYNVITGITRSIIDRHEGKNNTGSDTVTQADIFDGYNDGMHNFGDCIFERSTIDVLAYSMHQESLGKVTSEEVNRQVKCIKAYLREHKDDIFIYFPDGVFDPEGDKYRSSDKEYQHTISRLIYTLLLLFDVKLHFLKSKTIEDRIEEVKNVINER